MQDRRDPVSRLIFELSKLPGIGEKTATRLAFHILKQDVSYATSLAEALTAAKTKIRLCDVCFTFTEASPCRICEDTTRDRATICVIERPSDVNSIEATGSFQGLYHVLHGALSPLDGIGPDELKMRELLARLRTGPTVLTPSDPFGSRTDASSGDAPTSSVAEVILAMNPSVEGDATALYLTRLIRPLGVKVTQLAHGIPMGGQLEYTDRQTIGKAMENRVELR